MLKQVSITGLSESVCLNGPPQGYEEEKHIPEEDQEHNIHNVEDTFATEPKSPRVKMIPFFPINAPVNRAGR